LDSVLNFRTNPGERVFELLAQISPTKRVRELYPLWDGLKNPGRNSHFFFGILDCHFSSPFPHTNFPSISSLSTLTYLYFRLATRGLEPSNQKSKSLEVFLEFFCNFLINSFFLKCILFSPSLPPFLRKSKKIKENI